MLHPFTLGLPSTDVERTHQISPITRQGASPPRAGQKPAKERTWPGAVAGYHPRPSNSHHSRRAKFPPELRTVDLNAAGVDVEADRHYVAIPEGRDPEGHTVRSFGAFTADLQALATCLRECGVENRRDREKPEQSIATWSRAGPESGERASKRCCRHRTRLAKVLPGGIDRLGPGRHDDNVADTCKARKGQRWTHRLESVNPTVDCLFYRTTRLRRCREPRAEAILDTALPCSSSLNAP